MQLDIACQLGLASCLMFTSSFNRPNLEYAVLKKERGKALVEQLVSVIAGRPGGGPGGRGFIGLAAMIFGAWNPIGAVLAALIFGFSESLQQKFALLDIPIPSEFLAMAPYLVTIVVVAGVVGRVRPPAADGQPYEKQ